MKIYKNIYKYIYKKIYKSNQVTIFTEHQAFFHLAKLKGTVYAPP